MRSNMWLAERLVAIHQEYFSDVPITNTILVRFGRASKFRFGSIIAKTHKGYSKPVSIITINALFKDEEVPDYVVDATLAHEFTHYTHGFHSPLKQLYRYPHQGDIVNKELRQRGFSSILEQEIRWAKKHYPDYLKKHHLL